MSAYRLYRQVCSLAPPPPRTPARPDPQVPSDPKLGPARWGKIGALYVYLPTGADDPAFGLNDIEISLQRIAGDRVRVETYAIADGYQQGGAKWADCPLTIRLASCGAIIAEVSWTLPDILDGCADPVTFACDVWLSEAAWRRVELVEIDAARG